MGKVKHQDIQAEANNSLNVALSWLKRNGLELTSLPGVSFIDSESRVNPSMPASVRNEEEVVLQGNTFLLSFFGSLYGEQGLEQALPVLQCYAAQFAEQLGPDITLFRPVTKTKSLLEEIMLHSAWHLLEQERDVFNSPAFVGEAIALYVQDKFSGRTSNRNRLFFDIWGSNYTLDLYLGIATAITKLYGDKVPLTYLLSPDLRKQLAIYVETELAPPLLQRIEKKLTYYHKKLAKKAGRQGYTVSHTGAFRQSTYKNAPIAELPLPFVMAETSGGTSFVGRIYDFFGPAFFNGTNHERADFMKLYLNGKKHPLTYSGRQVIPGVYVGTWHSVGEQDKPFQDRTFVIKKV